MQNIPDLIKNLLKRNLTLEEINFLLTSKNKNVKHLKTNLRIIKENADRKAKSKTKGRNKKAKSSKKGKNMTEERFTKIISNALAPIYLQIKDLREDQTSLRKMIIENKADTDRQIGALRKDIKQINKHLAKIDSRIDNLVNKNNLKE